VEYHITQFLQLPTAQFKENISASRIIFAGTKGISLHLPERLHGSCWSSMEVIPFRLSDWKQWNNIFLMNYVSLAGIT